jgi:spermidine synthase
MGKRSALRREPVLTVAESRGLRSLHIGGDAIQSAMRVADPDALALDYTRTMMAFLLFHPEPRRVLTLGLGGGSIAKFIYRRLPRARQRVVELDRRVVAVARAQFALPANDARLAVEIGDASAALAPQCCDTLIVDVYDDEEHVAALASVAFYDAAWLALRSPGVLVANFASDDPQLDRYLERLERAFAGAVVCLPALSDPNVIVFALKGVPERLSWSELRERAERLEAAYRLPFSRNVAALKRMNPCDAEGLFIVPPLDDRP